MAGQLSEKDLKEVIDSIEKFKTLDLNLEKLDLTLDSGSKITIFKSDENNSWYLK